MDKTYFLTQSTSLALVIAISLIFASLGILHSKKFPGINNYLTASRSIGLFSLTTSLVASALGAWILFGPVAAATWGGVGAVIGYALGTAFPMIFLIYFGKKIRNEFPELPKEKEARYQDKFGLSAYDSQIISSSKSMADFFDAAAEKIENYSLLSNWLIGEISAYLNKEQIEVHKSKLTSDNVAMLINRIDDQTISGKIGKSIFEEMCLSGSTPDEIIESQGLKQISDDGAIEEIIMTVISENPSQVKAYLGGKDKLFGFFVGQVMKLTEGKANPKAVNSILKDKLK